MRSSGSLLRTVAILAALALQLGCSVALGPGFGHPARAIEATASASAAPIHLRVADTLRNNGNRPLEFLDFDLAAGAPAGMKVSVDGRDVQLSRASSDPDAAFRLRFAPRWPVGEKRAIVFEYDLQPEVSERGLIASTPDGICIADRSAFPVWQAPPGIFAQIDLYASSRRIALTVPPGFRALAAGRELRSTRTGASVKYEFRAQALEASPYLIAGQYQQQRVSTTNGEVIFWTLQPLDPRSAQSAAERLAAANATFERLFGPISKTARPLYVVESPAAAPAVPSSSPLAFSFPNGVILDRAAFVQNLAGESTFDSAYAALARIWFGWYGTPGSDTQIVFGRGLPLFAVALEAEARGGDAARRRQIAGLLAGYNLARAHAPEPALLGIPASASDDQQAAGAYRAALFWAALEDLAGSENFARAIRRYWAAERGLPLEIPELRSALEASSGRDFAAAFRAWLDRPGIPEDFSARYSAQP